MAYADPQSVTVSGTAVSLPRTGFSPTGGSFTSSDGKYKLEVSHQYGRRQRRSIRLTESKISADPLVPSTNTRTSMSVYMVVDTPLNGVTAAEAKAVVDAFVAYMAASSGARVTQLLGGEV
jgi:hypothetical protein